MASFLKSCVICGEKFTAYNPNSRYCSEECRDIGKYRTRREWENKTGYHEKNRKRLQEMRAAQRAANEDSAAIRASERKKQYLELKKELLKRRKEERAAKLEAGDPITRKYAAVPFSVEYWEAYKDYEEQYAKESGIKLNRYVNGISVNDPEFPLKVTITIQELGGIFFESGM